MSCCLSPIEYFIEYADYLKSQDSDILMEDILNDGYVFPNTINMCCPNNCSEEYILIGQGMPSLLDYINDGPNFNFDNCCVNVYSLFSNFKYLNDTYFDVDNLHETYEACCNDNNSRCINELLEHTNSSSLNQWFYEISGTNSKGLVEYNVINEKFGFCELVNILKTKSPAIAEEYMLTILNKGLVISCKSNGTFVGSLQTYMDTYYLVP